VNKLQTTCPEIAKFGEAISNSDDRTNAINEAGVGIRRTLSAEIDKWRPTFAAEYQLHESAADVLIHAFLNHSERDRTSVPHGRSEGPQAPQTGGSRSEERTEQMNRDEQERTDKAALRGTGRSGRQVPDIVTDCPNAVTRRAAHPSRLNVSPVNAKKKFRQCDTA
jgi:hypothetical protein